MPELEGPNDPITLPRASELSGLRHATLRQTVLAGRLTAVRMGRDWFTTRRSLHAYLIGRSRGRIAPLPADYVAPEEGE